MWGCLWVWFAPLSVSGRKMFESRCGRVSVKVAWWHDGRAPSMEGEGKADGVLMRSKGVKIHLLHLTPTDTLLIDLIVSWSDYLYVGAHCSLISPPTEIYYTTSSQQHLHIPDIYAFIHHADVGRGRFSCWRLKKKDAETPDSPAAMSFSALVATTGFLFILWHTWHYDRFRWVFVSPPADASLATWWRDLVVFYVETEGADTWTQVFAVQ